jgi:hypothetical protein
MMRLPHFEARQKLGVFMLLFQREIYPWLSLQIFPLVAFWWVRGDVIDWFVPIFIAATIFATTVGPGMTYVAYRLSHSTIRKKKWFWQYGFFGTLIYTEAKNVIARVAHIKEAMSESSWRVTPRSADPSHGSLPQSAIQTGSSAALVGADDHSEQATALLDSAEEKRISEHFEEWDQFAAASTPDIRMDIFDQALQEARNKSERQAARKLGVDPIELSMVAFHLWGHSFSTERNERARRQAGPKTKPATLRAVRGHITRRMLIEVAAHLHASGFLVDWRMPGHHMD